MRALTFSLALCLFAVTALGADETPPAYFEYVGDGVVLLFFIDRDGDGIPDDVDECPRSDNRPTIVFGECDSGVPNVLFPNGCTLADEISELRRMGIERTGQFLSALARLLNEFQQAGVITGAERGAIQSCAARGSR